MNIHDDLQILFTWPVRDMVELKTTPKLRAASAGSTIESPSFSDLSPSNFLSCCGVPSNRNSVFDGLRRSLLDAIQDCTSSKTADNSCTDESHDRLSNALLGLWGMHCIALLGLWGMHCIALLGLWGMHCIAHRSYGVCTALPCWVYGVCTALPCWVYGVCTALPCWVYG